MSLTLIQFHIDHSGLLPLLVYNLSIQERNLAAPLAKHYLIVQFHYVSTVVSQLLSQSLEQVNSGASQLKKKCFFVRSLIIVNLNIQENTSLSFTDHFKDIINLINIFKKGAILLSNNIFFISLFHFPQKKIKPFFKLSLIL